MAWSVATAWRRALKGLTNESQTSGEPVLVWDITGRSPVVVEPDGLTATEAHNALVRLLHERP
jgi:hypothetical protein